MKFNKYMAEQAESTKKQVSIKIDEPFSWVTITAKDDPESCVFLQAHDAVEFINKAKELSAKYEDELIENCYMFLAYDYLDIVFHC